MIRWIFSESLTVEFLGKIVTMEIRNIHYGIKVINLNTILRIFVVNVPWQELISLFKCETNLSVKLIFKHAMRIWWILRIWKSKSKANWFRNCTVIQIYFVSMQINNKQIGWLLDSKAEVFFCILPVPPIRVRNFFQISLTPFFISFWVYFDANVDK